MCYVSNDQKKLQFEVVDKLFHKVSPKGGLQCFDIKGKLSLKFIRSFEVLRKIGVSITSEVFRVHNVFHVSQLRKYVHEPSHVLVHEPLQVNDTLTFDEMLIRILDT